MNDEIRAKTEDWLKNPPTISREDTEAAFEELADKVANSIKNAIEGIGVGAVEIDKFVESLVVKVKSKL